MQKKTLKVLFQSRTHTCEPSHRMLETPGNEPFMYIYIVFFFADQYTKASREIGMCEGGGEMSSHGRERDCRGTYSVRFTD